MAKAKPQFLTTFYTSECETEKREIELAKISWEKFDELSGECVSKMHRNPKGFIVWVMEHYLFLCDLIERFDKGVLPDGIEITDNQVETLGKIVMSYKGGAEPVDGEGTPYIKEVGIPKPKESNE